MINVVNGIVAAISAKAPLWDIASKALLNIAQTKIMKPNTNKLIQKKILLVSVNKETNIKAKPTPKNRKTNIKSKALTTSDPRFKISTLSAVSPRTRLFINADLTVPQENIKNTKNKAITIMKITKNCQSAITPFLFI